MLVGSIREEGIHYFADGSRSRERAILEVGHYVTNGARACGRQGGMLHNKFVTREAYEIERELTPGEFCVSRTEFTNPSFISLALILR
jgi:hypothetical protein